MNPCVAAVILLLLGRNLGHAGCNVIVLLAAILMFRSPFGEYLVSKEAIVHKVVGTGRYSRMNR